MLNLSALFLSQKRMNEVLSAKLLHPAARHFSMRNEEDFEMNRRNTLTAYESAALKWLQSAQLPTLGELIAQERLNCGAFFTHLGTLFGKNITQAASRHYQKKAIIAEPILWAKLEEFGTSRLLTMQLHPENYTTNSAAGEMAGKKRLFLVGRITECDAETVRAQAYLVGHLHSEPRPDDSGIERLYLLGNQMEVFPPQVDNFDKCRLEKPATASEQRDLLAIPEREIKEAFAAIIGETYIPKDWGGETSDLVSTHVHVDSRRYSTAFAFKGPSKAKTLTMADLGKNGDQIYRLFSEPADFVVLQHCYSVASAVRAHMRAFATQLDNLRPFCIIDGNDTIRILRAYEKLGFSQR
jgi:hypothetical protein